MGKSAGARDSGVRHCGGNTAASYISAVLRALEQSCAFSPRAMMSTEQYARVRAALAAHPLAAGPPDYAQLLRTHPGVRLDTLVSIFSQVRGGGPWAR